MKVWTISLAAIAATSNGGRRGWLVSAIALAVSACVGGWTPVQSAAQSVVNVYSSRHYDTDEALYKNFTAETGIEVRIIEGQRRDVWPRSRSLLEWA